MLHPPAHPRRPLQILNVVGVISKHPDCKFTEVIAVSRGTVLTLSPWQAPATVTRVWCLFEAMRTLQVRAPRLIDTSVVCIDQLTLQVRCSSFSIP